jgi:uncharacterized membrane protein YeaQ/YmgE (transglycosylase-associated protein family)
MPLVQVAGWLIAGAMASWLVYTLRPGRQGLGPWVDWVAGPVGALLGGLILVPVTGQRLEQIDWWLSIPAAYAGALVVILFLRILLRARPSP